MIYIYRRRKKKILLKNFSIGSGWKFTEFKFNKQFANFYIYGHSLKRITVNGVILIEY